MSEAPKSSTGVATSRRPLQLYHALRLFDKISQISFMDSLLKLCAPTIFDNGVLPAKGGVGLANLASLNMLPGAKKSAGRGAIPMGCSSSLIADLTMVYPFHLSAALVKELMDEAPHHPFPVVQALPGDLPRKAQVLPEPGCAFLFFSSFAWVCKHF